MKTNQHKLVLGLALLGAALTMRLPAAMLSGNLTTGPNYGVDLTSLGTTDWALWGYAGGGTSTSLTPDVRMAGGSAISDLAYFDPNSQPLRGIGQFNVNFQFSWNNGDTVGSDFGAWSGLQAATDNGPGLGVGQGFSFTVPATTIAQHLNVFVGVHAGTGQLTASLSDSSAPAYIDSAIPFGDNSPGVYAIDFAAASPGQTLTVSWLEIAGLDINDNPAIYAATLSSVPEPGQWAMMGLTLVGVAGYGYRRFRANRAA